MPLLCHKEQSLSKRNKVQPRKLKGFQDHDPKVMQLRQSIADAVRRESQLAGFQAISTPALEYADVLLGVGGETDKQVFRFNDNGGRDVALRFDLTVPFARYVAENHGTLTFPFKRMQIGEVWRAEKPQKGRYREFGQCDLDIIGVDSIEADAEIMLCLSQILNSLPIGTFTISLGHRAILTGLIQEVFGSVGQDLETQILIAIDKLDKVGVEPVLAMIASLEGVDEASAKEFLQYLSKAKDREGLKELTQKLAGNEDASCALTRVVELKALLDSLTKDQNANFVIDLTIARGLGYYTGVVFETTLDRLPNFGSICSGGRYNQLVERYLAKELPGIGGSIGLDRLLAAMQEMGLNSLGSNQTVFVAIASANARSYAFQIAQSLRRQGISCDIAVKVSKKIAQQFKHADRLSYPFVITVGEEEVEHQTCNVKNMSSSEQTLAVPIAELPKHLAQ